MRVGKRRARVQNSVYDEREGEFMRLLRRHVIALLLLVAALPPMAAAQPHGQSATAPYELFVTFGDSLADTGNVYTMTRALGLTPAIPPSDGDNRSYFNGRFSNGPVAFEYLWNEIRGRNDALQPILRLKRVPRKGGVDFAFGGSTSGYVRALDGFLVPGLRGQVELFLALQRGRLPQTSLFAIATGSNDYLSLMGEPPSNPADVVQNIVTSIEKLYARGARTVIVVNLSDLGAVPLVSGESQVVRDGLSMLSAAHNALLAGALTQLAAARPDLTLIPVDVNAVIAGLPPINTTVPAMETVAPGASACLFVDPSTCPTVPTFDVGPGFFFWDVVHPTTTTHQALSTYLARVLSQQ